MKHKLSNHDSQSEKRKNTLKRQREFKLKTTRVTKARENVGERSSVTCDEEGRRYVSNIKTPLDYKYCTPINSKPLHLKFSSCEHEVQRVGFKHFER